MVVVQFGMIRKWSEVLRCQTMWRGCIDKMICWWCVRSWDEIRMVHRSIRNGSRVADGLYIKSVLLALEDFLFFSLYSFSCIAKQVRTLKQLWLMSCLDSLETNIEPLVSFSDITSLLPLSPTLDRARYTNIPIENNCTDDELHFGMPGGSGNYEDEGDKSDERNAIRTASRRQ